MVIVPDGLQDDFAAALRDATIPCDYVVGGAERQHSVQRGLAAIGSADVVLVHDAARPLVPAEVVADVIRAVREGHQAAVPAVPLVDSVRRLDGQGSQVVDRGILRGVQTPQGFAYDTLVRAHQHVAETGLEVTDDAACCEAIGISVHLVPGSRLALKVTEPTDLVFAEALLAAYPPSG
jgi:2-C-methyl-D-erythritol 4-phosphate cytidylyltransferase